MSLRCVFLNQRTLAVTDGTASGRGVGGGGPFVSDQEHAPPSCGRSQGRGTSDLCEAGGEGTSEDP